MSLRHVIRPHVFAEETSHGLDGDAFLCSTPTSVTRIPLADVVRVELTSLVRRRRTNRICRVVGRRDTIVMTSIHYGPAGLVDDRGVRWAQVVHELGGALAGRPDVAFVRGKPLLAYLWGLVVVAMLTTGWTAVMVVIGPVGWCFAVPTVPLLLLYAFRYAIANRPRAFDPRDPPADLFPMVTMAAHRGTMSRREQDVFEAYSDRAKDE